MHYWRVEPPTGLTTEKDARADGLPSPLPYSWLSPCRASVPPRPAHADSGIVFHILAQGVRRVAMRFNPAILSPDFKPWSG